MNFELSPELWNTLITYAGKVALAVVALVIGFSVIGSITKTVGKALSKREVDPSLIPFLSSLISILLKAALVLAVLGMVGIETTSFIAILGAAGLAVGLALSGTLQNFAGGVMILLFKPFRVGDVLEAQGFIGKVHEIQIFNTIMKSPDNRTIIIPNGGLATGSMVNYSTEAQRRVDFTFGIAYGDSTAKAREVLMGIIAQDSRILATPAPFVAVSELADSSVNFVVRVWVNSADYWGVFFDMQEQVYNTFNAQGLNIPFPQMDVHVHNG